MGEAELWASLSACAHLATSLLAPAWAWIGDRGLRSVSVTLGERLELVDLSETQITDQMVGPLGTTPGPKLARGVACARGS